MPNWSFGDVTVTGTRAGVLSFVERFVSDDDPRTVPGKRFFSRSFTGTKRSSSVADVLSDFEGQDEGAVCEHTLAVQFAWSVSHCIIDGYPQGNPSECITLSEACREDQVSVTIFASGDSFEEHVACDMFGSLSCEEKEFQPCRCRSCGEVSYLGPSEDLDEAECPECGECGLDWVETET